MRRALVQLHLWLGLTVGLLWALQGLTGAALVFHREIDRLNGPAVTSGPLASLDGIVADVERATGAKVERIGIVDPRADLLNADYADAAGEPRALLVEAATGAVVAAREREPASPFTGSASRWLYTLHEALLLGHDGEMLIGVSGLILLTALVTGLWIAWPRRGAWKQIFATARWRTVSQRLFGWHRMAGMAVGFALLVTVPGGVYMIFAAEIRPAAAAWVPHQLPAKLLPAAGPATVSADEALEQARALFPGAGFVRLTLPTPQAHAYTIRLRQPDETRAWSGVTSVSIDAASGRILDIYDPLKAPLSNRLADAAFSVHSGELTGLPGRILLLLAGLSLPALYVTGILAWLRKRRLRRRKEEQSLFTEPMHAPAE